MDFGESSERSNEYLQFMRDRLRTPEIKVFDDTDESIFALHGALIAAAQDRTEQFGMISQQYAVYLADLFASTCADVEIRVLFEDDDCVDEVFAINKDGRALALLSWIWKCRDTPSSDSVWSKYAISLRDFGYPGRCEAILRQAELYQKSDPEMMDFSDERLDIGRDSQADLS